MDEGDKKSSWKYERGEGRCKHRWQYDYAGFVPGNNDAIGKCPKSITEKKAFPRLQFILTTHSPQVLTTVPSESIWVLDNGQAHQAPRRALLEQHAERYLKQVNYNG